MTPRVIEPVPDDKDWTWVLDRRCPECGFRSRDVTAASIGDRTRALVPVWRGVLARDAVRQRPRPATWSPLEYACHVRDVFVLFDQRLSLMRREDTPTFANWDQDATAIASEYAAQDSAVVSDELASAGAAIAAAFDDVRGDEWDRVGVRSNGSRFTIATFGRYFLHDVVHHTYDVTGEPAS